MPRPSSDSIATPPASTASPSPCGPIAIPPTSSMTTPGITERVYPDSTGAAHAANTIQNNETSSSADAADSTARTVLVMVSLLVSDGMKRNGLRSHDTSPAPSHVTQE